VDTSNIGQVVAWLDGFVDSFDFTRPDNNQSLGRDTTMCIVQGMIERVQGEPPGGGGDDQWDENKSDYAKWKEKQYQVVKAPNTHTGQMLDQLSLYGRTTIEPKLITMIYGINKPPNKTKTGVKLSARERGGYRRSKGPFRAYRPATVRCEATLLPRERV
jgi:hypothetical protein